MHLASHTPILTNHTHSIHIMSFLSTQLNSKETNIPTSATKDTRKGRRKEGKSEEKSSRGLGRKSRTTRKRAAED